MGLGIGVWLGLGERLGLRLSIQRSVALSSIRIFSSWHLPKVADPTNRLLKRDHTKWSRRGVVAAASQSQSVEATATTSCWASSEAKRACDLPS